MEFGRRHATCKIARNGVRVGADEIDRLLFVRPKGIAVARRNAVTRKVDPNKVIGRALPDESQQLSAYACKARVLIRHHGDILIRKTSVLAENGPHEKR